MSMPNNRRRRFSVKKNLNLKDTSKTKNVSQSSTAEKPKSNKCLNIKFAKSDNELETSLHEVHLQPGDVEANKTEKELAASSSTTDFFSLTGKDDDKTVNNLKADVIENQMDIQEKRDIRSRRDKFPRQHRIKVRSPKRRVAISDEVKMDYEETVGTDAIDWDQEVEECITSNIVTVNPALVSTNLALNHFVSARDSTRSFLDMCRICHGNEASSLDMGPLISTCGCRGTVGRVHVKCLERWLTESGKSRCELCGTRYLTRRVHKYGFPKALIIWILSHNAKQLMVDSLGIMLMSPLAVMAAWLSGRTLAGLLAQDSNPATWPLASTFVLACMTLVCYYCWIVSAVTRHALGWWVWYRSQYEVRLQFQDTEE